MEVVKTIIQVLLAILFILAAVSMAAGEGEPASLEATLVLLATGGFLTGSMVSDVYERFDWFQKLQSWQRKLVVWGTTYVLPAAALLILQFVPETILEAASPYFKWIILAVLSWMGSQVYHTYVNKAKTNA